MIFPGMAHLFPQQETAETWWYEMQCRLFTTACQLWHEEEEANTIIYGGTVSCGLVTRNLTGVLPRLQRRLDRQWHPATLGDVEGFLWSRLRFEYRTLLCYKVQPSSPRLWEQACILLTDDELVEAPNADPDALVCWQDESFLHTLSAALTHHPELLTTAHTTAAVVTESDAQQEDCLAPGWRKRVLARVAARLGTPPDTLHKRLERIRTLWQKSLRA